MRLALLLCTTLTLAAQTPAHKSIATVLDDWHLAAAQADEVRYFAHLAEDAVFLGTDASERWTKPAFQAWAHTIFQRGKAWSFKATRRVVSLSKNGEVAWFDEDLATPNLGPSRGSGVLSKQGGRWRIEQYNLSVPIPNALMKTVKEQIEVSARQNPAPVTPK